MRTSTFDVFLMQLLVSKIIKIVVHKCIINISNKFLINL